MIVTAEQSSIIDQYFRQKGCEYWKEQEPAYGLIDFKERTVIIVGADCGTTVLFSLINGAKHIIAYEKDANLRAKLVDILSDAKVSSDIVDIRGEWIGEYPEGNIFIQYCEGCELINDFNQIAKYEQSCIALHMWIDVTKLLPHFRGYTVTYVTPDSKEVVLCKLPNT